jgi:S-adenosylmethionine:diacylglycerol 3-amino-3-carboxypropyl transferase
MAIHATRRISKVCVGLERQADSVAVVELAAVRMSDSDVEVIIASSSKENFGMKYDTYCKTVSTGKFKGVWNQRTMRGRGEEEEEDLDLFAQATLGRLAWLCI